MKKNKGIKIYKQKKRKGASNSNQILSILITSALVFGVAVFGYYVVAIPFSNFVETYKNRRSDESSLNEAVSEKVTEQTIPLKTEPPVPEEDYSVSVTEKESVTTAPAVTTVPVTSFVTVTLPVTVTSYEASQTVKVPSVPVTDKGGCVRLSADDLRSAEALEAKLDSIGKYESVILPLKVTGGRVYYDSAIDSAHYSGAVVSDLDLDTIVNICSDKGIAPVAEISTISDNIYPVTYKKSAYQFDDGYTGEWLDSKADEGGKPWLSPFSDIAKDYLSELVSEITSTGISKVICTDTVFPPFREKDLGYIGDIVKSEDRYKGLTGLINLLDTKASENSGRVMLYVSASDIFESSSEVFHPEEFGSMSAVIGIRANDLSGQSAADVMKKVSGQAGSMNLIPCIISDGMSEGDIDSAVSSLEKAGYDYYMVR